MGMTVGMIVGIKDRERNENKTIVLGEQKRVIPTTPKIARNSAETPRYSRVLSRALPRVLPRLFPSALPRALSGEHPRVCFRGARGYATLKGRKG